METELLVQREGYQYLQRLGPVPETNRMKPHH